MSTRLSFLGCALAACIGVQGIAIDNSASLGWSMSGATYARWLGGTSPCDPGPNCVPSATRPATWGTIKSLYR